MRPIALTIAIAIGGLLHAQQPAGGAPDRVVAVKQSLQQGLALARQYEWVETTIISLWWHRAPVTDAVPQGG